MTRIDPTTVTEAEVRREMAAAYRTVASLYDNTALPLPQASWNVDSYAAVCGFVRDLDELDAYASFLDFAKRTDFTSEITDSHQVYGEHQGVEIAVHYNAHLTPDPLP